MAATQFGEAPTDRGAAEFDHWIYGVVPGVGYSTKACSHGLDAGLYDPYLRGHYTPIRAATAQSTEGPVDLHMIHPVRTGREILLSRITRGPPDEAGRPTFSNHTAVAHTELFRSGQISIGDVYRALEAFDREDAEAEGELELLRVPVRSAEGPGPRFGSGIHKHLTFPALETLATRIMSDPGSRTLLLCRNTGFDARNATLHLVFELLGWGCGLPLFTAISDSPRASALNFFNLVIAPRGVRADSTWAILESALAQSVLPRVLDRDDVYDVLTATFRHSADLVRAR